MISNHKAKKKNRYRFSCQDADSEYDSEGDTTYRPHKKLHQGEYADARLFTSLDGEKIVVLKPVSTCPADFNEAKNKAYFFEKNYPSKPVYYIEENETYRLVLPFMEGNAYDHDNITSQDKFLIYFISAVKALKRCHARGLIVIDLKGDGILYDPIKQKSYLIDGGLSRRDGELLGDLFFRETEKEITNIQEEAFHMAPECWSLANSSGARANEKMDIFSLGAMMRKFIMDEDHLLYPLVEDCQNASPELRPSLDEIEEKLLAFQKIYLTLNKEIHFSVDFIQQADEKEVGQYSEVLMEKLDSLIASEEFAAACKMLNVAVDDQEIKIRVDKKKKEILALAESRVEEISDLRERRVKVQRCC